MLPTIHFSGASNGEYLHDPKDPEPSKSGYFEDQEKTHLRKNRFIHPSIGGAFMSLRVLGVIIDLSCKYDIIFWKWRVV